MDLTTISGNNTLYLVLGIFTFLTLFVILQRMGILDKLLTANNDNNEGLNSYINSTELPKYFEYYNVRYPIIEIIKTTKDNYGNWSGKITYTDNSGNLNTIEITNNEYEIDNEPENIMNNVIILRFLGSGGNNVIARNLANAQKENILLKSRNMVLEEKINDLVKDNSAQLMKNEQEKGAIHGSRTISGFGGSNYEDIKTNMGQGQEVDDDIEE